VLVCLELTAQTEAVIPAALVQLWQPVLYLVNKLQIPHIVTLCTCVLELTAQTEAVIPAALVQLWQPVLYLVNKLQLTAQLLDSLASQLSEDDGLRDCLSAGWISRIVTAISSPGLSMFT